MTEQSYARLHFTEGDRVRSKLGDGTKTGTITEVGDAHVRWLPDGATEDVRATPRAFIVITEKEASPYVVCHDTHGANAPTHTHPREDA